MTLVYCIIRLIADQSAFNSNNKTVHATKAHGGVTSSSASVQFPQTEYLKLNPLKSTKLGKLQMHPSKVLSDLLPDIISSSLNFFDAWSFQETATVENFSSVQSQCKWHQGEQQGPLLLMNYSAHVSLSDILNIRTGCGHLIENPSVSLKVGKQYEEVKKITDIIIWLLSKIFKLFAFVPS